MRFLAQVLLPALLIFVDLLGLKQLSAKQQVCTCLPILSASVLDLCFHLYIFLSVNFPCMFVICVVACCRVSGFVCVCVCLCFIAFVWLVGPRIFVVCVRFGRCCASAWCTCFVLLFFPCKSLRDPHASARPQKVCWEFAFHAFHAVHISCPCSWLGVVCVCFAFICVLCVCVCAFLGCALLWVKVLVVLIASVG